MPASVRRHLPTRWAASAGVLLLTFALTGAVATAQEATTTTGSSSTTTSSTTTSTTTTVAPAPDAESYAELANQVSKNQELLDQLNQQIATATRRLLELAVSIADTQHKLDATRAAIAHLKQVLRARAAYIYQHARAPQLAVGDISHVEDLATGRKYADSAAQTDGAKVEDLGKLSAALDTRRQQLDAQRAQQQQERDRLDTARVALEAVNARQKKLLDEAGAVPVMGDTDLTATQITDWFNARGAHYRLADGISIGDLVRIYLDEGKAEHVRGDLAFAQSIIETGSFANTLDDNYSGIGACDTCKGEPAFPTPRDGVRGQIQLLKNYADPTSRAETLANPPSPTIYGNDPVVAAHLYDTFFAKGRVPTWNLMGNGNWATDPNYAQKVLTVFFQMVSFAAQHS